MNYNVEIFEDLHDCSLIDINIESDLTTVEIVLSAPIDEYSERMISFICKGVLRFEYETLGNGEKDSTGIPIEIYDVYNDKDSNELERWRKRIELICGKSSNLELYCVVFASSFIRGWGNKSDLEGINIICQKIDIKDADKLMTDLRSFFDEYPPE